MSGKRLKIFAFFCIVIAAVCIARLAYIQLNSKSAWQSQLEKIRTGKHTELAALRGKILDRNGKVLATDEACFTLCIDYRLARLGDERFWRVQSLRCESEGEREKIREKFQQDYNTLNAIIAKCAAFKNCTVQEITEQLNRQINEPIWQLRFYLAGKRKYPKQAFEAAEPDADKRLLLASQVDIAEMHQPQPLIRLENDDEVLAAQLKFIDTEGVQILPRSERVYPYKNSAAQLVGWVKPWNPGDESESNGYEPGDVTGFCGIEYLCEPVLKGRSGKIVYNLDNEVVSRTERQFGSDVKLTIDIELQQKVEKLLKNPTLYPTFGKALGIVVIDVNSTDIITIASIPDFDLNIARWEYSRLLADGNHPLLNRNLTETYPPGSSAKPIILAAAMEEKKVTADEVISCPSSPAPSGWPNCWITRTLGYGHDEQWAYEGGNKARNALRGSCNIYFSHIAVRVEPRVLQQWLLKFGFGKNALETTIFDRTLPQSAGIISSAIPQGETLPPIDAAERRFFGIGQGNFRTTPLQVANAFAAIARRGVFKRARIIATEPIDKGYNLNLGDETINVIFDGMHAVVTEPHGTAFSQFSNAGFEYKGVKVYGKTGSTERPYHAWFAGFAKDSGGKSVAFAVLVEGGQHGSSDAGPIARDIVSHCIETGYLK
ncbi:MAG: penicillin-binding transpeptidase domain-containing protein [Phycisphaerae bacterium]|nr:penicillin-binding transpeptidase domain-containing protein [Phycisphaerae bacterium]